MTMLSDITILVIDDDMSIRFSIVEYLSDHGYYVFEAEAGEQALAIIQKQKLDVVIVDIRLPGIFGDELVKKILALHPDIKVIIYTGSVDYQLSQELKDLGVDPVNVLLKPIEEMSFLKDKIQGMLRK